MKTFKVTCVVTHDKLSTITDLLAGECKQFSVTEISNKKRHDPSWALKHVDKLLAAMHPGIEYTHKDMRLSSAMNGALKVSSLGTLLADLTTLGRIKRIRPGIYGRD